MRTWGGACYPLAETWDGVGVNFALFSVHAEKVGLCFWLIRCCRVVLGDGSSLAWERGHPARTPGAGETHALPGTSKRSTPWFASKGSALL